MNKYVLDSKAGGKMKEISQAEKKLVGARVVLDKANLARLDNTRQMVKIQRRKYAIAKQKGDVNGVNKSKKYIRMFKRKVGRIVKTAKALKRVIIADKKSEDDKYMASQDQLILKAKEEVIKAEMTGRFRAIKMAKAKKDAIKTRKEKQQKSLNQERINDSTNELKLSKKNVKEAEKTKNLDLILIARKELKHARSNFAKSNIIKLEMAKKIMDEKEEKLRRYKAKKIEIKKEVKAQLKKANMKLIAVKKENIKEKIDQALIEVRLQKLELKSIEKSGSQKSLDIALKNKERTEATYKLVVLQHGDSSDEAFQAEEMFKKAENIAKYEKRFMNSNKSFIRAEKELVKEKKNKKKALVKENRDQLKETKVFYRAVKQMGSKGVLRMVKKEIRADRKS